MHNTAYIYIYILTKTLKYWINKFNVNIFYSLNKSSLKNKLQSSRSEVQMNLIDITHLIKNINESIYFKYTVLISHYIQKCTCIMYIVEYFS
jgi:hypothetical protein